MSRAIFDLPIYKQLYNDAVRLPEARSTTLMVNWLRDCWFPTAEGFVVDQENPTREHHDLSRMDIAVKTLLLDPAYVKIKDKFPTNTWVYWLPGEGKVGKAGPGKALEAEEQAYSKVWNYLKEVKQAVKSCWVITYYGSRVRLWSCHYESTGFLVPFYPDGEGGRKDLYADIKTCAEYFDVAFDYITKHLQPDPTKFEKFWAKATSSLDDNGMGTLTFPTDSSDDQDDEPAGIYWGDLTQVEVLEVLEEKGQYKTLVQYPEGEDGKCLRVKFPLHYWREAQPGEIRVHQNLPVQGYIAPEVKCWAWKIENPSEDDEHSSSAGCSDSEESSDLEESDTYSSQGHGGSRGEGRRDREVRDKEKRGKIKQGKEQEKDKKAKDKKKMEKKETGKKEKSKKEKSKVK